jgi:hypothetical protein
LADQIEYPLLSDLYLQQKNAALQRQDNPSWSDTVSSLGQLAGYGIMGRGGVGNPMDAIKKLIGQRQALSGGFNRPPNPSEMQGGHSIQQVRRPDGIRFENSPPGWREEYPVSWLTDEAGQVIRDPRTPRATIQPESDITQMFRKKTDELFPGEPPTGHPHAGDYRLRPLTGDHNDEINSLAHVYGKSPHIVEGPMVNLDVLWNYLKSAAGYLGHQ